MKDLSIIIPHYNSAKTLKKLLLSIPKRKNIQIIVVDDKSNNELVELNHVKEDDQFNHVQFLNNSTSKKGAGVCRNIGLNHTKGKWVLFADADDYFVKGFYDVVSDFFDSNLDVVFFKPTSVEVNTNKISDRHINYATLVDNYINEANNRSEVRLRYRYFVPWSKLIRYEFLCEENILFEEIIASNDILFSSKAGYYMKDFKVVQNTIYCVTRGFGTLTTNINPSIYEARIKAFIKNYKFLQDRLEKKDFKLINLHGLGVIFGVYRNKLGIKKMVSVFMELKKNKINILDKRLLNPKFAYKRYKQYLNEKKYLLKR